jgi:mitochondrial fission protein ELM1
MSTMPPMPQTQNPANKPDPAPDARPADRTPPRVWVVTGYRAGERTQILGLADALGWPYEIKALGHRSWDWAPGLARRVSIAGIDPDSRAELNPPWPDLVISAGMRNEPVVRWIKARSDRQTKLVHLGRPWVHYRHLDLVITTPQYRLPDRPDVLQNLGTLHRVNAASLEAAGERWAAAFADLPRPRVGVIVGGHSGPYTLGPAAAADLGRRAAERARSAGGSLMITTSSRTPPGATAALTDAVDVPAYVYRYGIDAGDNPYLGILAAADELIVTSDSIAMLSEAVAAGKPLSIYDLAQGGDTRLAAQAYRFLMRHGHPRLTRDLSLFHEALIESGRAAWLGAAPPPTPPPLEDTSRAVRRVRRLLGLAASTADPASAAAQTVGPALPRSCG